MCPCPRCRTPILYSNFANRDRGYALYICPGCGFEQGVEELHPVRYDGPPIAMRVLSIRWREGVPSIAEIASLRQLLPRYADTSIVELRDTVARPELPLGESTDYEARQLAARCEALGLTLVVR
jgi:hypothetical protein